MRPKHVVIINDASIAKGGATGLALLSAKLLRDRGFDVTYICGDEGGNAIDGVEMVPLGGQHIAKSAKLKAAVKGVYNHDTERALDAWITRHDTRHTVYHIHGWSKILSPSIFVPLRRVAARAVVHAHDFFLACPNGAFFDYPAAKICDRKPLGRQCLMTNCDKRSRAQKYWRVSRSAMLGRILRRGPSFSRLLLIHEGMERPLASVPYFRGRMSVVRNPAQPFCKERVPVEKNDRFFFVGRVEDEKGVGDACAAAHAAGVPLHVIGDGPALPTLREQYKDVVFHGWQSHAEISEKIRTARALLMPSRYPEPFGLVAVEASWSGIPVIATNKAFLSEELAIHGLGVACDTTDETTFSDTLRAIAGQPSEEIRAMSERGFSGAFPLASTTDEWCDALIAHYQALLAKRPDVEMKAA